MESAIGHYRLHPAWQDMLSGGLGGKHFLFLIELLHDVSD